MRIIFVRHGQTSWNLQGKIQGQKNIPLDNLGMIQAKLLCSRLKEEEIDIIFSSPLARAFSTAEPLTISHNIGLITTSLLSERNFGVLEGFKPKEVGGNLKEKIILEKTKNPAFRPNKGESLNDLQKRILDFLQLLNCLSNSLSVLCVTHGGILDLIYRKAMNKPLNTPRDWIIPNTAINIFEYSDNHLSLKLWADTNHLKKLSSVNEI